MAKPFASDNAMRVTIEAAQMLGGAGYVTDFRGDSGIVIRRHMSASPGSA